LRHDLLNLQNELGSKSEPIYCYWWDIWSHVNLYLET